MDTVMTLVKLGIELCASNSLVIGIAGSGLVLNSFVKVGPGRAFSLALRSRLFRRANPTSARAEELQVLRTKLKIKGKDQYVVVTGPKGVGKTVLIRSATSATCGVVDVEVSPGSSTDKILHDAYCAIVNPAMTTSFLNYERMALRALWFYNIIARQPPTIVVHLQERMQGEKFASITGAVRKLAGQGFNIVVDSSTHAAPFELLNTRREKVIELDYMPAALVSRVDKYKTLFETLEKYSLVPLVWEVVGGLPAVLEDLCVALKADADPEQEIFNVLRSVISRAVKECFSVLKEHSDAVEIFQHFQKNNRSRLGTY